MEKILFLIFCVSLISCSNNPNRISNNCTNDNIPWEYVTEFNYKGHDYIKFDEYFGYRGYAGVVHDPECKKCLDKFD